MQHAAFFWENNVLIIGHIPAAIRGLMKMAVLLKVLKWLDVWTCWQKFFTDPSDQGRRSPRQRHLTPRLAPPPRLTGARSGKKPAGFTNFPAINRYFPPDFTSPLN
jgi:hypothetical protein